MSKYNTATSTAWSFDHDWETFEDENNAELGELLVASFTAHYQDVMATYRKDGPEAILDYLFDPWDTYEKENDDET